MFCMEQIGKEELEELLRQTKEAHAEYERDIGSTDEDWPAWYAEYMIDKMEED